MRDDDLEVVAGIKGACGAASAIVLYRFATSAMVRRMRMAGHAMARSTSDATELEAICLRCSASPSARRRRAVTFAASASILDPLGSTSQRSPSFPARPAPSNASAQGTSSIW